MKKNLKARIHEGLPFCKVEIVHSIQEEMALHLEDIVRRRKPLILLTRLTKKDIAGIAILSAKVLGWNKKQRNKEIEDVIKKWSVPFLFG